MPTLSELLQVSRTISSMLLARGEMGGFTSAEFVPIADGPAVHLAAAQLRVAAARARLTPEVLRRVQLVESLLGRSIIDGASLDSATADIADVLTPGARVCFTGTFRLPDGRVLPSGGMESVTRECKLEFVPSVTKKKCDALVVAEAGTQSGKARKAIQCEKPIFTADEFFEWIAKP